MRGSAGISIHLICDTSMEALIGSAFALTGDIKKVEAYAFDLHKKFQR